METTSGTARIEYVALSEIRGAPRNPKDHDLGAIHSSIARFGFTSPVMVDERTGRLVAGHGRLEALRSMKAEGQSAPERVEDRDGEWFVPVVRGVRFRSDEDAEGYVLADNRLVELGGWDDSRLADVLSDLAAADALEGVGWDKSDVDEMLAGMAETPVGKTDPDEVPEPPAEPISKREDVWLLGRHRAMCGDALAITEVEKLLSGAAADMVYTDPPYGINALTGSKEQWGGVAGNYRRVMNDEDSETARAAYQLVAAMGVPIQVFWGANHYASALPDSSCWIVWHKKLHGDENDFADCELAWTNLSTPARVFAHAWNGFLRDSEKGEKRVHPTQKPVALAEWCLEKYGKTNERVLDLFGGSGSTLIACERTDRMGYLMELDEAYVDVICRRFQEYTGIKPILESSGEEYDFTDLAH